MSKHLRIGEVAATTVVSLRTIRYYDEVGLVRRQIDVHLARHGRARPTEDCR